MYIYTYSQSHLGWHFRKLKAPSLNVSFATFQWKETFELWALSFETPFENVTPSGIGCTYMNTCTYDGVTICVMNGLRTLCDTYTCIHKWVTDIYIEMSDLLRIHESRIHAYVYYTYTYEWVTNFVRYVYIYVYMSISHEHMNRNDSPTAYTWVTHTHIIHIHIDESRTLWDTNPCIHVHENESRPYTSKWVIHCTWVTNIRISYVYTYKCVTNILI